MKLMTQRLKHPGKRLLSDEHEDAIYVRIQNGERPEVLAVEAGVCFATVMNARRRAANRKTKEAG